MQVGVGGEIETRRSTMTKEVQATQKRRIQGECCAGVGSNSDKCLNWMAVELANVTEEGL